MTDAAIFVEALRNCLAANAENDSALCPFTAALECLAPVLTECDSEELGHPLLSHLGDVLNLAHGPRDLIDSVAALSSADGWYQVYTGEGINAEMADYMLAKQIVGSDGPIVSSSVSVGLFLLAPYFEYRMHSHAALEVYYVHSGAIDIRNGTESPPRHLSSGQYSVTPSGMPHALYTGDMPVLLLFVWTGDMTAPIWWWVRGDGGGWKKILAKNP